MPLLHADPFPPSTTKSAVCAILAATHSLDRRTVIESPWCQARRRTDIQFAIEAVQR
jgi:hypothetical protein